MSMSWSSHQDQPNSKRSQEVEKWDLGGKTQDEVQGQEQELLPGLAGLVGPPLEGSPAELEGPAGGREVGPGRKKSGGAGALTMTSSRTSSGRATSRSRRASRR